MTWTAVNGSPLLLKPIRLKIQKGSKSEEKDAAAFSELVKESFQKK
jgi:hypothetical protein